MAPHGSDNTELNGRLADGVTLHLHANIAAKVRVDDAPHCQVVRPGTTSLVN